MPDLPQVDKKKNSFDVAVFLLSAERPVSARHTASSLDDTTGVPKERSWINFPREIRC